MLFYSIIVCCTGHYFDTQIEYTNLAPADFEQEMNNSKSTFDKLFSDSQERE